MKNIIINIGILLMLVFSSTVLAVTINVPNDVNSIQEAIDIADDGDTIYIENGFYDEELEIEKNLTIIGESREGVIINSINANGGSHNTLLEVSISHLTAEQINFCECPNSTIDDVNIIEMYIEQSPNTTISNNHFTAEELGEADGLITIYRGKA